MTDDIYHSIYRNLEIVGILSVTRYDIIKNDPLLPLYIDRLGPDHYAIAHNHEVDDVLVPDPDMEIKVDHSQKTAEPLTFQDERGRKVVYPEPGKVNLAVKNELVVYLDQWLKSLVNDGYRRD